MTLEEMRREYIRDGLSEAQADADPVRQFATWFDQAAQTNTGDGYEPNAMTLATATPEGVPSARIVLLKGFDEQGFVFYTNYMSQKGIELERNAHAALVFHWPQLERQVRIDGTVTRVSRTESEAYFRTRPRGSQVGAWASQQSEPVDSRETLERAVARYEAEYAAGDVPRPPHWSGYRVVPDRIEFWTDRRDRLHDRELFERDGEGWKVSRLQP